MSGNPEEDYLADGMAEEIITALSPCAWLFVIARNSSFTYKGKAVDVRQVGRELGVRNVLEGSVRRPAIACALQASSLTLHLADMSGPTGSKARRAAAAKLTGEHVHLLHAAPSPVSRTQGQRPGFRRLSPRAN